MGLRDDVTQVFMGMEPIAGSYLQDPVTKTVKNFHFEFLRVCKFVPAFVQGNRCFLKQSKLIEIS